MCTLVVGATGQLGTAVTRKLLAAGGPVRAFARRTARHDHLAAAGAEVVFGDLRDAASVDAACRGAHRIVATANAVGPGAGGGAIPAVDGTGYGHLIEAARRHGCKQFIFASVPVTPRDDRVPQFRIKRLNERRLIESGVPYTIFRLGMFTDVWPALLGSRIPYRGSESPTLERPFRFLRVFRKATGDLIERKGKAMVPGPGHIRVSFIAIDDVATILANAVDHPEALDRIFEVAGPEVHTFDEVVAIFGRVLDRPIKASYTPPAVFRAMQLLLKPYPAASIIMGVNWLAATGSIPAYDPERSREVAEKFGVPRLAGLEEFLREKASLQPA